LISNILHILNVVFFLLGDSRESEFYVPTFRNTLFHLHRWCKQDSLLKPPMKCSETSAQKFPCLHHLWWWNRHSVPKRRHIKFRRRGVAQKKEYKILFTPLGKVWLSLHRFSSSVGRTGRNSFPRLSRVWLIQFLKNQRLADDFLWRTPTQNFMNIQQMV